MEVKYNISRSNKNSGILYDNTYPILAQKSSPLSNNHNQQDKYRILIEKLVQLRPNNLSKFLGYPLCICIHIYRKGSSQMTKLWWR